MVHICVTMVTCHMLSPTGTPTVQVIAKFWKSSVLPDVYNTKEVAVHIYGSVSTKYPEYT